MTPSDAAENEVEESRQYSVSNPVADTTHTIALVPSENVTVDADGVVSFSDADDNDEYAEFDTDAYITVVNGAATGNDGTEALDVETVMPSGGTISFTVTSDVAESVIPVVFFDADEDGALALNADNEPTEDEVFGIGGMKSWIPAEATFGSAPSVTVADFDLDANWLHDGSLTYYYSTADNFVYEDATSLTYAQFEAHLSDGDEFAINYNPDGTSTFTFVDDVPAPVSNLTATNTDTDADGVSDDVALTWDAPPNFKTVTYDVERAPVAADGTVGAYSDIVTGLTDTEYDDENLSAGTYSYVVEVNDGTNEVDSDAVQATVPAAADTTGPVVDAVTFSDTDTLTEVDSGDQIAITFNEAVVVADGDEIELTDDDGTVGVITLGSNATWSLSSNSETLFVTLTANPVLDASGTTLAVDDNVLISDFTGITDEAGNAATAFGDPIVLGADVFAPLSTSVTIADNDDDGVITTGDVITVVFDEDVASAATNTVEFTDGTNTCTPGMGRVISDNVVEYTLSVDSACEIPSTLTVNTDDIEDLAGNLWDIGNSPDITINE